MDEPKIVSLIGDPVDALVSMFSPHVDLSTVEVISVPPKATDVEVYEALTSATVILTSPWGRYLNRKMLEAAHGIKLIQFGSVGYDNIDLEAATELKIPVANNPGWNAVTVAEHALMMMLVLLKRALYAPQMFSQGRSKPRIFWQRVGELGGRTLGILGLGSIGKEVARLARAFGPRIIYHKRTRLSEAEEMELGVEYCDFDRLLSASDILSIHVPLTGETRGMVGREEIARMKTGAILINTTRREVVDEAALAEAIKEGKLSGAGIDVPRTPEEITDLKTPLVGLENVMLTPHTAGGSRESYARGTEQFAGNIKRALSGEKPLYVVNDV